MKIFWLGLVVNTPSHPAMPGWEGVFTTNNVFFRFNQREYSQFRNSLVASYLSYCEYYRCSFSSTYDFDRNGRPASSVVDPDPGAMKLTKINKQILFLAFQFKTFVPTSRYLLPRYIFLWPINLVQFEYIKYISFIILHVEINVLWR